MPGWATAPADSTEEGRSTPSNTAAAAAAAAVPHSNSTNSTIGVGNAGGNTTGGSIGYMIGVGVGKGGGRASGNLNNRQVLPGNGTNQPSTNPQPRLQPAPRPTAKTSNSGVGLGLDMSGTPTSTPTGQPRPSSSGGPGGSGWNGMAAQDGRAPTSTGTNRPHSFTVTAQAMTTGITSSPAGPSSNTNPFTQTQPSSSASTTPQNQYDTLLHGGGTVPVVQFSPAHVRNIIAALETGQPLTTTSVAAANTDPFGAGRTSFSNPTPPQTAHPGNPGQVLYPYAQQHTGRQVSVSPEGNLVETGGRKSSLEGPSATWPASAPSLSSYLPKDFQGQASGSGQMIAPQQQRMNVAGSIGMGRPGSVPAGQSGDPLSQAVLPSPLHSVADLPQYPPRQSNLMGLQPSQQLALHHQHQQHHMQHQHQLQRQQMHMQHQQQQQHPLPQGQQQQQVAVFSQPVMQNPGQPDQITQQNVGPLQPPRRIASTTGQAEMSAPPPAVALMTAIEMMNTVNSHNMQVTWDKMQETITTVAKAAEAKANEDASLIARYRSQRNQNADNLEMARKETAGLADQLKDARDIIKNMGVEMESRATRLTLSANVVAQQNIQIEADVTMKRNHTTQIDNLKAMNDKLKKDLEAMKKAVKENQATEKTRKEEDLAKLDKFQKGLSDERAAMKEWQKQLEEKLAKAEEKVKKAEEEMMTAQEDLIEAQSKLDVYSTTAFKSNSDSSESVKQLKDVEAKYRTSADEVTRLTGDLETLRKNFDRLKKQEESIRAEARATEEILDKIKAERDQLEISKNEASKAKEAALEASRKQKTAIETIISSLRKRFGISDPLTSSATTPAGVLTEVITEIKNEMDKLRSEVSALTRIDAELQKKEAITLAKLESAKIGKVEKEKSKLVEDLQAAKLAEEVRRTYASRLEGEIKELKEKIEKQERAPSASVASSFEEGEIISTKWAKEKKELLDQIKSLKEEQNRLMETLEEEKNGKESSNRPISPKPLADTRSKSRTVDPVPRDGDSVNPTGGAKGPPTPDSDSYSNGAVATFPKTSKSSTPVANVLRGKSASASSRMGQAGEKMGGKAISDDTKDAMGWGLGRGSLGAEKKSSSSTGSNKAKKPRQTDPGTGMKGGISVNDPISIDDDDDDDDDPASSSVPMAKSASGKMLPPPRSKSASVPSKTSKKRSGSPLFSMTGNDEDEDDGNDTPSSVTKFKKRKKAKRRIDSESPSPEPRKRDNEDDDNPPSPSKPRDTTEASNINTTSTSTTTNTNSTTAPASQSTTSNYQPQNRSNATTSDTHLSASIPPDQSYNVHHSPAPSTMSLGSMISTKSGIPSGRPVPREWAAKRINNLIATHKDGKSKVCKMCITEMPKEERKRIPTIEREPLKDGSMKGQLDHIMSYHADTLRRFKTKRQNAGDDPPSPI